MPFGIFAVSQRLPVMDLGVALRAPVNATYGVRCGFDGYELKECINDKSITTDIKD